MSVLLVRVLPSIAAFLLISCARSPVAEVTPATDRESGAFVVLLGSDTIAVESFTRTGTSLEGDLLLRVPSTRLAHYVVTLNPSGHPVHVEYEPRTSDGMAPATGAQSVTLNFASDSITRVVRFPDSTSTRRFVNPGAVFPWLVNSMALYEPATRSMRAAGIDSGAPRFWNLASANIANPAPIRLWSDSARLDFFGSPLMFRIDNRGRILSVDGSRTTLKISTRRQGEANVAALAASYAARDRAGAALGTPSPRDTARASVRGATLLVDYGRPSRRGRNIWVNGVLGDTLWRTGANAATQFTTDRDIVVAGAPVPAGTYTLWTHTRRDGSYQLVINRQSGQWGTVYDPARDLVRVPLERRSLGEPVERFRIAFESSATGAFLRLAWDTTELSVPIQVR